MFLAYSLRLIIAATRIQRAGSALLVLGVDFLNFFESELDIFEVDVLLDNLGDALLELLDVHFLELAAGHVLDLVEKHLSRVELGRVAGERQHHHSLSPQKLAALGLQLRVGVMDQIALYDQVGWSRVCRVLPSRFLAAALLHLGHPPAQEVQVAFMGVETAVDVVVVDAVAGSHDADMQDVVLIEDVVEVAVVLALHPHAAPALVQRHVGHREEEQRLRGH